VAIGNSIILSSWGGKNISDKEKKSLGKSWFNENISEIREAVCSQKIVQK
jgi:hypothetical protein